MVVQRVHVWVAGKENSIYVWGWTLEGFSFKYVELVVTDGLKFWDWGGEASSPHVTGTGIVGNMV